MTADIKIPDASHSITVDPTPGHVRVLVGDTVIAESDASLTLREASYPPVQYVPLTDIDASVLSRTDTISHCPYKGDASYYSVTTADGTVVDAGWTYDEPYESVAPIATHVAFYPGRADVVVGEPA